MVKTSKRKRTIAALVALPVLLAVSFTALRAPAATVEGYGQPLGFSSGAPARDFAAALKDFPISIGGKSFTAGELGVGAAELPSIPRAWSFGAWGRDFSASLELNEDQLNATLAGIEGYSQPVEPTVSFSGESWIASEASPGLALSDDPLSSVAEAIGAGRDSLELQLEEIPATVATEEAQKIAETLNAATVEIYAGSSKVATLGAKDLSSLLTVEAKDGELLTVADSAAVGELVESYGSLSQERVDGEQVVGDDGSALKIIEESQDGFNPAPPEELASAITESLEALPGEGAHIRVELPGEVDAAEPRNLNRSAIVDISDHYAYFYENGEEVARFPVAVGKPGYETNRGTFKVYAQLTAQNMGSCDAAGNYLPDSSFGYCTANVPWISYFNGDEGFHGTYWHSNFGNPSANMSHGCVNMTVEDAEWSYRFLQTGSTVTVRD